MNQNERDAAQGDISSLRRELEEEKDRHLRTLADFDNYRKRVERDSLSSSARGKKELIGDLLGVLDGLEMAIGQMRDEKARQGLEMVHRQFTGTLSRHGLEPVESLGMPFDPDCHEGIGYVEDGRCPPGHVAQELCRGYRFGGDLLRPATVRVAKGQVND
ncbi:MAG: nucleotide exchange factor GrpE [Desulfocucumaceae bacterium]